MLPRRDSKPLEYAALLPMFGGMEKKPRFVDKEVLTVGRARGSDLCLDGNEVSAIHCLIYRAPDGFRVRDCGSRTGTRINGQGVKNALLGNGDVLQIGPFSFEARIPRSLDASVAISAVANTAKLDRLARRRVRLIHLALGLRKRLRERPAVPRAPSSGAIPKNNDLQAKIKQYDAKLREMEDAEAELQAERDELQQKRRSLESDLAEAQRIKNDVGRDKQSLERDFEARRATLEAEFQTRWESLQGELDRLRRSGAGAASANSQSDILLQELQQREDAIRKQQADVEAEAQQVKQAREALEQLRAEIDEQRAQLDQAKAEGGASDTELDEQKQQLADMMEQVRQFQDDLRAQAAGAASAAQDQMRRLQTELDEARKAAANASQLDAVEDELDAAHERIRALETALANVKSTPDENVTRELDRLRRENAQLLSVADELQAKFANPPAPLDSPELDSLRRENENLLRLADELQAKFALGGADDGALDALRRENEALRDQLASGSPIVAEGGDAQELRDENRILRKMLDETEAELKASRGAAGGGEAAPSADVEGILAENDQLRGELGNLETQIETLKRQMDQAVSDPETFEAELLKFRKEVERDREKLNEELEGMRQRQAELDDATRDSEMEMSRERATLARERIQLERMREELRVEAERMQREGGARGSLAPVQKLREQLYQQPQRPSTQPGGRPPVRKN